MMTKKYKQNSKSIWQGNFLILWSGQLVSALGDSLTAITMGFWVLNKTNSTTIMSSLLAIPIFINVLSALLTGAIADRVDRKKLMIVSEIIRALMLLLLAILIFFDRIEVWMLYIFLSITSLMGSLFEPCLTSALPDVIPAGKLIKANAALGSLRVLARICGNSLGGILYGLLGAAGAFLIDSISFLISALSLKKIKIPKHQHSPLKKSLWQDIKDGIKYTLCNKGLLAWITIAGALNFCMNIAIIMLIPIFNSSPNLGAKCYGLFMSTRAVGFFLGTLILPKIALSKKSSINIVIIAEICFPLFFLLSISMQNLLLMILLVILAEVCNAFFTMILNTSLQLNVPSDKRGKIFSLTTAVFMSLSPISIVLGGILAEIIEPRTIALFALSFATIIASLFAFIPSFKEFIKTNES